MIDLERIAEDYPEALKADGFDEALIGVAHRAGSSSVLAYSIPKCLEILEKRDGMTPEGAQEFFDFNVVDAFMGEHTPVFLEPLDTGCQTGPRPLAYSEVLDPLKQKRVRVGNHYAYRYVWTAPQSLRDQGFSSLHAIFTIEPSFGFHAPAAIISPYEVWFESKRRIPYNTKLSVRF